MHLCVTASWCLDQDPLSLFILLGSCVYFCALYWVFSLLLVCLSVKVKWLAVKTAPVYCVGWGVKLYSIQSIHFAVVVRTTIFKSVQGSVVSDRIGMKFGRIVPQVNSHFMADIDIWYDVIRSRWRPWRHTPLRCPPSACDASSWSIVHSHTCFHMLINEFVVHTLQWNSRT